MDGMFDETNQFALFFKRRFYLSKIAVSSFARCLAFRVVSLKSRGFGPITGRERRRVSLSLDGRYITPGNVPRRKRGSDNPDISLFERKISVLC